MRDTTSMPPRIAAILIAAATLLTASSFVTAAEAFPTRPMRVIVAVSPGGSNDLVARLIAAKMSEGFREQLVVVNRAGGGGVIGYEAGARATPDGHTLLFYGRDIWIVPFLNKQSSYDPVRDFAPITLAVRAPSILVVHPSLPVNNVRELIALAKARPGQLNYGSSGIGSSPHLAAELFKSLARVNIVHVRYKGAATALPDLFAGQLQLMFNTVTTTGPYVKLGKVKALAVTSAQPSPLVPGLPTIAASGLPGYEAVVVFSMLAPAATPPALVNRLREEIARVLHTPDVKERLFKSGTEVVASSPGELAATMKSKMSKWGNMLKEAGIRD